MLSLQIHIPQFPTHTRFQEIIKKKLVFPKPCDTISNRERHGSVSEWLMEADCKSAGLAYAGSNPARPTFTSRFWIYL